MLKIVLKIVAVACQGLDVDPIGRGEKIVFSEKVMKKYRFSQKRSGKICAFS